MVEHEAGEFLAEGDGGTERGQGFAGALFPVPQPDGVEMGVADEMNFLARHRAFSSVRRPFHPDGKTDLGPRRGSSA